MSIARLDINGVEYISYASVDEADKRLAVDVTRSTAWMPLTDDRKAILLVAATNRIDLFGFAGEKTNPGQENMWPREGIPGVDKTQVPHDIEQATILLAGTFASDPAQANPQNESAVKKVEAGPAKVEFFTAPETTQLKDRFALNLLKRFFPKFNLGGIASGTDGRSVVDEKQI